MAKETVDIKELEAERSRKALDYEVIVEKLQKLYKREQENYNFYKRVYMDHVEQDKHDPKIMSKYESYKKLLDDLKFYFRDYLVDNSSDNIVTEIKDDELPF